MADATNFAENEIADWIGANGAPSAVTNVFIKLHIGAPGEDATGNPAGETTRQEATFGAAASGVVSLSATVSWTNVSTTETYSHFSLWDASSAGNPLVVGALDSPVAVTAADDFDLTALTVTVA
jgi:hypothetical protein